jgi:hypothetical protein
MAKCSLRLLSGLLLLLLPLFSVCRAEEILSAGRAVDIVKTDFGNFYLDRPNQIRLGIGIAVHGLFANTNMDRYIRDRYQENIRSDGTDRAAKIARVPGEVLVAMPVYIGIYGAGGLLPNPTIRDWAQKSFRATVVGAPALAFLALAIGSDRPTDGDSKWRPFHGSHGVSGHAFFGGVPFITAAKMTENPYHKGVFYGLSTFAGLSRINDDLHYFSQAALGWYLAYLSCDVVLNTDKGRKGKTDIAFVPVGMGFAVAFRRDF